MNRLFLCVLLGAPLTACGPAAPSPLSPVGAVPADGTIAGPGAFSGWTLENADGATVDLGDLLSGDCVVLSFFATYCTRCMQKLIDHQALHERYAARGVAIVGVSVDEPETQSSVATYVRSRGLTFPVVIDAESRLVSQLNPRRTLPFSVLLDKQGKVLWSHVGYVPGDEKLFEEQIVKALKK